MDSPKSQIEGITFQGKRVSLGQQLGLILLFSASVFDGVAQALDWKIRPNISMQEIYSDNINLATSGQEDDALVTQLAPGVSVNRDGSRNKFNLNYRIQSLFYAGTNRDARFNNQLQMNSKTEILDDSVYVDSSSSIGQANLSSTGRLAADNISNAGNTTEFRTFRISPYWRPHLGGYADGEVRVSYSHFSNGGGGNFGSNSYQEQINLRNGRYAYPFGWRANFNNQDMQRDQGSAGQVGSNDIRYQNYNGEVSYRLGSDYSVFVQAGCFNNDFQGTGTINNARNGCYETLGAAWTPSPKFSLSGGYGINNRFASLNWNPSQRTTLQVTYRDSNVGGASGYGTGGSSSAGFGGAGFDQAGASQGYGQSGVSSPYGQLGGFNSGSTWYGLFQHRTRRTTWNASYTVANTTIQQVLQEQQVVTTPTDAQGHPLEPVFNPIAINTPNFTNDVITSKTGRVSVTGFTAKSSLSLSAYQTQRTYQTNLNPPQDILGFTASWNWRFASRTSSTLLATWQQTDNKANTTTSALLGKNELINVSLRLNRQISSYLTGFLELRHLQQDSDTAENKYDENRVTASLNVSF